VGIKGGVETLLHLPGVVEDPKHVSPFMIRLLYIPFCNCTKAFITPSTTSIYTPGAHQRFRIYTFTNAGSRMV
jgi:hypothetical protein